MKSAKNLWRLTVITSREAEDAIAELLGDIFHLPTSTYFDFETQTSLVSVYCEKKLSHAKIRKKISDKLKRIKNCGLNLGAAKIQIAKLKHEDWAQSWKKHFHAIEIGKSLLVKPSWIKKRPRKNQAVVILDPGLSFGTGQHPTTKFCLKQIVKLTGREDARPPQSKSFLDIGTGSGILAIAAAKLGYEKIYAIDFDSESVRIAKANARANGVFGKIKIARGDVTKSNSLPKEKFDLVCANLISNLLIAEKKKIISTLKPDGILVLAGILSSEFSEVQSAFENSGLELIAAKTENEWRSGAFQF